MTRLETVLAIAAGDERMLALSEARECLVSREATPEESALWQARYTTGYQHGRGDTLNGDVRADVVLAVIPAEVPGETGSRYVARHLDDAYRIGYTRAWQWYSAR